MAVNFKPVNDRVVLTPMEEQGGTSPGGIIIPDTSKEKPVEGKVVAVGPGRINDSGKRVEMTIKVGDEVIYSKYAGTEIKKEGEDYVIVRESDILAVIN